jgi:hypothetical protein
MDESGNNPATLKLHRVGTSGNVVVTLAFTGTASFGDDYIVEGLNVDNTATIPSGQQDIFIQIDPVPDTRYEGNESVIVTIQAAADGSYTVGSPSSQTLTLIDDDVQQIPANGWVITELGSFGGASANAFGINTIYLGNGQFRGQMTGFQIGSQPAYKTMFWDNGTIA